MAVAGLTSGDSAQAGVPQVSGVRAKDGQVVPADLVVDMTGRRSALPGWLEDIGPAGGQPHLVGRAGDRIQGRRRPIPGRARIRRPAAARRSACCTPFVLRTTEEVFARPGLRDKILQMGSGWRDEPPLGPSREQLLALVSAQ